MRSIVSSITSSKKSTNRFDGALLKIYYGSQIPVTTGGFQLQTVFKLEVYSSNPLAVNVTYDP